MNNAMSIKYLPRNKKLKAKLIVELDGSQHFEDKNIVKDNRRTAYFESLGLYVLRFADNEINESFYEVCAVIDEETQKRL